MLLIEGLATYLEAKEGWLKAVDGVDLTVGKGELLGIVGESGCGKTMLALTILRLVPKPIAKIVAGHIIFQGMDLLKLSEEEMRRLRGKEISMIFQEPMTFLNPVLKIGEQIAEVLRFHLDMSPKESRERTIELLKLVGVPAAERRIHQYPHQLSGGLRQRVLIAMAVACNPQLILADEPTTALDVTIQAQILALLDRLRRDLRTALILISHDLGLVAEISDRVLVMYAGKILEDCPAGAILSQPYHPYTEGLLNSLPGYSVEGQIERLKTIPGHVPPLHNLPVGCRFQERCSYKMDICEKVEPTLKEKDKGHLVRCWKYE